MITFNPSKLNYNEAPQIISGITFDSLLKKELEGKSIAWNPSRPFRNIGATKVIALGLLTAAILATQIALLILFFPAVHQLLWMLSFVPTIIIGMSFAASIQDWMHSREARKSCDDDAKELFEVLQNHHMTLEARINDPSRTEHDRKTELDDLNKLRKFVGLTQG